MQSTSNTSATRVEPIAARADWDTFVRTSADATFFHQSGWTDVLVESFGFRSCFLAARRAGRVVGVLPLCELSPPMGRPRLLSLPFAVEAGVAAIDAEARSALEAAAVALAQERDALYLELRDGHAGEAFQPRHGTYFRFRRTISDCDEENLRRIPRKQRRMIRVGQANDLRASIEPGTDVFYDLYARSQRRLGTPLLPQHYFASLVRHFPEHAVVLVVRRGDTPVAAVLSFFFRDQVLPYYAGSRDDCFRYGVNDFMYWELMRLACRRGALTFDFGRSKRGSGAFDYKRHWGFDPEPLCYRVHALGRSLPHRRAVDDTPVRLLSWGWRRLPLAVTKTVGPFFSRRFAPYFT